MIRIFVFLLAASLFVACGGGNKNYKLNSQNNFCEGHEAALLIGRAAPRIEGGGDVGQTLFVHPGLIFGFDWGGGRAVDAGRVLQSEGYFADVLEIRSRSSVPIYKRMMAEEGQIYLGLHYSIGASPEIVQQAVKASEKVSENTNRAITYNAVLVDPYRFMESLEQLDLDSPALGMVIVVLSSQNSFLRPRIEKIPDRLLKHNKFYLILPEEFGLEWDHFGFLSAVRERDSDGGRGDRIRQLFFYIVTSMYLNESIDKFKHGLSALKCDLRHSRV